MTPGLQTVKLSWQQSMGISERFVVPVVNLGLESVNSAIKVMVPRNRWVLFTGGPRLGPADSSGACLSLLCWQRFYLDESSECPSVRFIGCSWVWA